ncbi:TlpA family protein disulfide reductase [Halomonas campisalis]|uniref:TlpA family protein disulfide reductase n=1 Tax=Billgrantia campisalis TaxID=74661 RepID=A0ABS9PCG1_9GAMM|nr:TlpA disulfide reductase family protein [Halomonas campisalis]MCG6659465.1 TlpA family protein disulfide reductase [Halomonas campisalis]MDR5864332.1 TlpA disulfide reductase family protein [Halomonas campisalis]
MDAFALGPVLISIPRLYALASALLLLAAAWLLLGLSSGARARWFNGLILAWLVGARLGHVAMNLDAYAAAPLDVLKLWLPGYHGLWGLLAALIWTGWTLRDHLLRLIGAMALTVGASALWLVLVTLAPLGGDMVLRELPDIALENLEGETVHLQELRGELVVVNLWATWCPPCVREMPLLAEADARDGVSVVVVNQGEDLLQVVRYLDEQELAFRYPLLDPYQELMMIMESPGLPTTVLFDAEGRAVERHVGELSRAQLDGWLRRH